MPSADAVQTAVVTNNCAAKLGDVVLEVNQVLALFVGQHVVKVNVLVSPFKVVDNTFVCQLLLHNEERLEELSHSFVDVEVVKFRNHRLLVLQVFFEDIHECVSLVDN
jgi:hypothetical protein